jgi:hypothetical protein
MDDGMVPMELGFSGAGTDPRMCYCPGRPLDQPSDGHTTLSRRPSPKTSPTPNPARHIPPTYPRPPSGGCRSCNDHHPRSTLHQRLRATRSTPTNRRRSSDVLDDVSGLRTGRPMIGLAKEAAFR